MGEIYLFRLKIYFAAFVWYVRCSRIWDIGNRFEEIGSLSWKKQIGCRIWDIEKNTRSVGWDMVW